ncbi:unnamed protein product [Didymodactylos carnosus]|uniref:Mitochondrial carrier protein n=1 Tax=Didymodactylos carnosus TaxID=1234261 RepID=A0A813XEG6_9BILA|nr:unnamed protein product [Didymodactylos carnosus]CAF1069663.1 unnamed protein product [Didymodactylos carnosus]CAF3656275.1 unnamed protein product [Didymodactylos carnosus]CAF3834188.1 unnamed protein product [Didymodactylos carnosus]
MHAGATSGAIVSVLVSPLDVIKTRIQVKRLPKNVRDKPLYITMYDLYKVEGGKAFYKGLGTTMMGYIPNWAIFFCSYQWAKPKYSQIRFLQKNDVLINCLSSITAGAVCNIVTAPLWTIRTRMMTQINHQDYKNSFDCMKKIYTNEGIYSLYRGVVPSMWGLIHVGIQFPLYEYLKTKSAQMNKKDHTDHLSTGQLMFASSMSKVLASIVAYPHEIVRSRLQDAGHAKKIQDKQHQTQEFKEYKNVRDAVSTIFRDEGLRGFFRGLLPNLLKTVPAAVLTLLSYEKVKELLTVSAESETKERKTNVHRD